MEKKVPIKIPNLEILYLVRSIRERGRPDAVERKANAVRDTLEDMREQARKGRRDHYTAMFMIEMTANNLAADIARAREAEEHLKQLGWRMDEAGKVSRIRKGRGADLLAECVWDLYTKEHAREGNTLPVREKIAAALAPFFDADELSAESDAPIYRAIYNREYRRL